MQFFILAQIRLTPALLSPCTQNSRKSGTDIVSIPNHAEHGLNPWVSGNRVSSFINRRNRQLQCSRIRKYKTFFRLHNFQYSCYQIIGVDSHTPHGLIYGRTYRPPAPFSSKRNGRYNPATSLGVTCRMKL